MKTLMIVAILLIPVSAWAACDDFEYAELLDMNQAQLQYESQRNRIHHEEANTVFDAALENHITRVAEARMRDIEACNKIYDKIKRAAEKKGFVLE